MRAMVTPSEAKVNKVDLSVTAHPAAAVVHPVASLAPSRPSRRFARPEPSFPTLCSARPSDATR